jgi:cysteinyl-tRNA synthetase
MSNIDYKKMYENILFEKILLEKEYDNQLNFKNEIINKLNTENNELKEHLKKYTAPKRSKTYYEKNKEKIIEKIKANKPSPEKTKEYNKKSYENRKQKKQKEQSEQNKTNENNNTDLSNKN